MRRFCEGVRRRLKGPVPAEQVGAVRPLVHASDQGQAAKIRVRDRAGQGLREALGTQDEERRAW
ncbi:hypothetical protein AB0N14_07195 [Streptomyces sp. NPDC051104]|uniref:hypothetical protein n=1 Tax=Streptomyces sp. NPDC051104 TaxID=3155044 RepID=UPI00342288D2